MRALLAICRLTVKGSLRSRAVLALASGLGLALVGLPLLIQHDGTAHMLAQVTLTYSFGFMVLFLGLATLWTACSSFAGEMADRTIQMVVVKPVNAWQVWLGKWMGITLINLVLLTVSAFLILLILKTQAAGLGDQEKRFLQSQVLVSRGSVSEPAAQIDADIREIKSRVLDSANSNSDSDEAELELQIQKLAQARHEVVHPGYRRIWELDLGAARSRGLEGKPLQIRAKFHAAQAPDQDGFSTRWQIGNNTTGVFWRTNMVLTQNVFHEFDIPENLFDPSGKLVVEFHNLNQTTLLFPMEDGLEVLFPDGTFAGNLFRACLVVLLWLAALSALGLWASTFLSFPVAAFLVSALLILLSSGNMMSEIVQEGGIGGIDHETHEHLKNSFDWLIVPFFKVLLAVIGLFDDASPLESLGGGRTISIQQMSLVFLKTVLIAGGLLTVSGVLIFNQRELATVEEGS